MKAVAKELSFNVAGHILHSLFWNNLRPGRENNAPAGAVAGALANEFGSFDRFKKEFSQTAVSCEGSGWAALIKETAAGNIFIGQIEKHNLNLFPEAKILLAIDVWEHAYYLDYKNDRAKFIDAGWNIIDWDEVNNRMTNKF